MVYERDNIRRLAPYVPGEQPHSQQVVKLNTNENPYPPPPAVIEAIRGVCGEDLRRYPPPTADCFRAVAARVHGVDRDQVIATNGGDELLRLAITVFCEPAGQAGPGGIGRTEPTYGLLDVLATIHDTPVTRVELEEDWSVPDDFADRLNAAGCRLAVLVNPHAPSGRLEPLDRLERFAGAFAGVLLIDEAYVDFAGSGDGALRLLDRALGNVLLLRTLSKGYSLAGLRFGYGLGLAELIGTLHKARDSFNTDIVAQTVAAAALTARDAAAATWKKIAEERARLSAALTERGYHVDPSEANFVLATLPDEPPDKLPGTGPYARSIYEQLAMAGIFVRYFDQDRLRDRLRITIGTPSQNDALLEALDQIAKVQ